MKDVKQVLLIFAAIAFVGVVGSTLFTVSTVAGWIFFLLALGSGVDYTFNVTGLTTRAVEWVRQLKQDLS